MGDWRFILHPSSLIPHPSSLLLHPSSFQTRRCIFDGNFSLKDSTVVIVGLGLMGGSLALALKEYGVCRRVGTLVRRAEAARQAEQRGVVDFAATTPADALPAADMVVFSTPVRVILQQMVAYAPHYKPNAIITDLGSTKQEIIRVMNDLPPHVHPVGSHPMCGKEVAGLDAAEATLYRGAPWILTPLPRTPLEATETVRQMALSIGARVQELPADRHDRLVATISHLPHTLASVLVLTAQEVARDDPAVWEVASSGFRDTSRVAAADVTMMLDILLTNRTPVLEMLSRFRRRLEDVQQALSESDETTLRQLLETAAQQRRQLFQ